MGMDVHVNSLRMAAAGFKIAVGVRSKRHCGKEHFAGRENELREGQRGKILFARVSGL
jgi:hypothetical protein